MFSPGRQLEIQHQASETLHLLLLHLWFIIFFLIHCLHCRPLSLCDEDIPPKASCMSRLSKLYIESLKKLRPSLVSKLCCVTISSSPPTVPFLSSKPSPFLNPWFWWIRVPEAPKLTIGFLKKTSAVNWWGGGGILRLWRAWSKSGSLSLNPASYFARLNLLTAWVNRFVLDLWTELRCGLFTPLHGLAVPACFQIGDPWLFPRRCWHSF